MIVNQIGMRPLIDDLQARFVLPLARMLFPTEGAAFTSHHSFMVQYKQVRPRTDRPPGSRRHRGRDLPGRMWPPGC